LPLVTLRELVEAGMHFGHRASRWNPKMARYIFGKQNLIHIIDLRETVRGLVKACKFASRLSAQGRDILFVGTKRQARNAIRTEAYRCKMHFVCDRWLGGTLTNFDTIRLRLRRLAELEELEKSGDIQSYSKKMGAALRRERQKIERNLEGIRNMDALPGALVVIDPKREKIAVAEATRLGIPKVCLADTDADPDTADVLVPGNDDAMRSIEVLCRKIADAVIEGRRRRGEVRPLAKKSAEAEPPVAETPAAETPAAETPAPATANASPPPQKPAGAPSPPPADTAPTPAPPVQADRPEQAGNNQDRRFGEGIFPAQAEARSEQDVPPEQSGTAASKSQSGDTESRSTPPSDSSA